MRRLAAAGAIACAIFCAAAPSMSRAARPAAERGFRLADEWRIEEADEELAQLQKTRPRDLDVAVLEGDLKFLHGDYVGAVEKLKEALARDRGGDFADEIRGLATLAQATADATKNFVETRGAHFVIRHAPGKDALLVPYALDALERAYAALGDDFGDRPSSPIRVEIYPEVADLAKVSPLTLKEIETSGTIALCKFNRLMIVSPRALLAGYPWLDTLTHEYTHFIVSRVSRNTVPIWLHEGLAKFEERRWHAASGGGLSPTMEHLLATGLSRHHLITFEQMHPSMAKLPSQEDTALAFSEVYMAVEYLHGLVGWDGLRKLVGAMRDGHNDAQAVALVLGKPFEEFQRDWRNWLRGKKLRVRPGLIPTELHFKKGNKSTEASEDDGATINEERARKLARLGGLLRRRHRLKAAAVEYEKAQALVGPGHLQVANKLARTYLELDDPTRAIAAAEPALELYPDQAAPNATLGASWLKKGDLERAQTFLEAAVGINPFDPALHCGLERIYRARRDARADQEGAACHTLSGE